MKKQWITLGLLAGLLAVGCNKKDRQQPVKNTARSVMPSSFTFYTYGRDITERDFCDNAADAADQRFNYINHAMTVALLKIYRENPDLLNTLLSEVDGTENKQRELLEFAAVHPDINTYLDEAFAERLPDYKGYGNWQGYIAANYKYDINYVPYVALLNPDHYDMGQIPVVSEPFEINEEKFTEFDDDYPLWIHLGSDDLFTTVNDRTVKDVPNPILAIRNGNKGEENLQEFSVHNPYDLVDGGGHSTYEPPVVPMSCNLSPLPAGHIHEDLIHNSVRIDQRYENTGKSEYRFYYAKSLAYKPATGNWVEYATGGGDVVVRQNGHDFKKEEIGTTTYALFFTFLGPNEYNDGYCFDIPAATSMLEYRHFVTGAFEWDWGAGCKSLGQLWVPVMGSPYPIKGRRKYESEWYFFDPAANVGYDFSVRNPVRNAMTNFTTKGELKLWRKDI